MNKLLLEAYQSGEWWIDNYGDTTYADGDVGDSNHEGVVIQQLAHKILSHFGIESDEVGLISEYEDQIKENLISDGRLPPEELEDWDVSSGMSCPFGIILKKLIEDKVFNSPEQASEALSIAYGHGKDARDFAMKYWKYKIMKNFHGQLEIQTWHLTSDDLDIIVRGVNSIIDDYDEDENNDPKLNITVQASGKRYYNIPLKTIEAKMPQKIQQYQSGVHTGYTENIMNNKINNEIDEAKKTLNLLREGMSDSSHHLHKEYRLYKGSDHITAKFNDGSQLRFEVHFRNNHGPDRDRHINKAFSKWKTLSNRLHSDIELNEVGNEISKSWRQAFSEALKHPELQEFIRHSPHHKIFDGKSQVDPVNFSPRI